MTKRVLALLLVLLFLPVWASAERNFDIYRVRREKNGFVYVSWNPRSGAPRRQHYQLAVEPYLGADRNSGFTEAERARRVVTADTAETSTLIDWLNPGVRYWVIVRELSSGEEDWKEFACPEADAFAGGNGNSLETAIYMHTEAIDIPLTGIPAGIASQATVDLTLRYDPLKRRVIEPLRVVLTSPGGVIALAYYDQTVTLNQGGTETALRGVALGEAFESIRASSGSIPSGLYSLTVYIGDDFFASHELPVAD